MKILGSYLTKEEKEEIENFLVKRNIRITVKRISGTWQFFPKIKFTERYVQLLIEQIKPETSEVSETLFDKPCCGGDIINLKNVYCQVQIKDLTV